MATILRQQCETCGADFYGPLKRVACRCPNCKLREKRRLGHPPKSVRRRVFDRDGYVCHLCGEPTSRNDPLTDPLGPTVDHVVPLSMGGSGRFENLRCAHRRCNNEREWLYPGSFPQISP